MKRRSIAILLALVLVLSLAACGAKSADSANYSVNKSEADTPPAASGGYWMNDVSEMAEMPAPEPQAQAPAGQPNSSNNLPAGVKMIYRANLEMETTEFEKAAEDIRTLTQSLGGYFEEQSASNYSSGYRKANYTVRVPAERFEDFLRQVGTLCRVTYQTQSAEDVSEYYYDTASRLETAKIKLDRLQELLSRADVMEDIITLEDAISQTEYQIESLSGTLRHYDSLIGYATIYVNLSEVYRVSEPESAPLTLGERLGSAFRSGLRDFADGAEDFAEWLAYNWLTLLALLLAAAVIVRVWRRRRKKAGKLGAPRGNNIPVQTIPTEPQIPQPPHDEQQ